MVSWIEQTVEIKKFVRYTIKLFFLLRESESYIQDPQHVRQTVTYNFLRDLEGKEEENPPSLVSDIGHGAGSKRCPGS